MKKVKILLMAVYNENMSQGLEDIGICFITSFLRKHGYEVMLMGVNENLIDYKKIVDYAPAIVGMPVYDISKKTVYHVIEELKRLLPQVFICVGGPLPTYAGREMMEEFPLIDFVVRGEGELTFLELVSQLPAIDMEKLGNIKGLTYRERVIVRVNENRPQIEDINILPMPARDILRDNNLRSAQISTSRGCKAKCTFCISNLFWKRWRGRSAEKVVEEIEFIVKKYGVKTFNFIDGSFEDPGPDTQRLWDIATGILKHQLNISYFFDLRAEFHKKANPELMMQLKDSGLCGVCVGIESANEFDLRLYGKLSSVEDNIKLVEMLRSYGIVVDPGFINFNPYSTFEGLRKNIDFLEKYSFANDFENIINKYRMFQGTRLYLKVKNDSLLNEGKFTEDGYRFVNKRIARLCNYVNDYITKIDGTCNSAISTISYYSSKYLTLLAHLKRQSRIAQKNNAYDVVLDFEKKNGKIVANVNYNSANWFRELLTLAENGWDNEKADEITNRFLDMNYIKKSAANLNIHKSRLYMKFIEMNLDSYLISMV